MLPYEQYLKRFPAYLQQLTMESNGKHVTQGGERVDVGHRPDLLGRARHQRPALVLPAHPPGHAPHPVRFHRVREGVESAGIRTTTCCSRTSSRRPKRSRSARRPPRSGPRARRRRSCPIACSRATGRPRTILVDALTPESLGKLVALYEHSVFTQAAIWDIDPFDQWGVELGKVLAQRIVGELGAEEPPAAAPRQFDQCADPPLSRAAGREILNGAPTLRPLGGGARELRSTAPSTGSHACNLE